MMRGISLASSRTITARQPPAPLRTAPVASSRIIDPELGVISIGHPRASGSTSSSASRTSSTESKHDRRWRIERSDFIRALEVDVDRQQAASLAMG